MEKFANTDMNMGKYDGYNFSYNRLVSGYCRQIELPHVA